MGWSLAGVIVEVVRLGDTMWVAREAAIAHWKPVSLGVTERLWPGGTKAANSVVSLNERLQQSAHLVDLCSVVASKVVLLADILLQVV